MLVKDVPMSTILFYTKSNLTKHINDFHRKLKLYKYEKCDYEAAQMSHLRKHLISKHNKESKFQCHYKADSRFAIQTHVKSIHQTVN